MTVYVWVCFFLKKIIGLHGEERKKELFYAGLFNQGDKYSPQTKIVLGHDVLPHMLTERYLICQSSLKFEANYFSFL